VVFPTSDLGDVPTCHFADFGIVVAAEDGHVDGQAALDKKTLPGGNIR
jgi:hypothetical protein